jgi:hypothetical protein
LARFRCASEGSTRRCSGTAMAYGLCERPSRDDRLLREQRRACRAIQIRESGRRNQPRPTEE